MSYLCEAILEEELIQWLKVFYLLSVLHADLGLDFSVGGCGSVIITPFLFLFFSTISAAQAVTYDCLVSRSVLI